MRARNWFVAAALAAVAVPVASAPVPKGRPSGDWPQWRGPNRDGHSPCKGLLAKWPDGGPRLLWQVEKPDVLGVGYGSVAVANGRLFALGAEPPTEGDKATDEYCTCLRASNGGKLWRTKLGTSRTSDSYGAGPASTPSVFGDRVYVLSSVGELICLSADTGELKWRKHLIKDFEGKEPSFGFAESPLVDDGRVIVSPGDKGGMAAFDAATGKSLWRCQDFTDETGYSSAVVAEVGGVRQYVRQTPNLGIGVRAKDGKLLWQTKEPERGSQVIPTAVFADGHAFFTNSGGCECFKLEKDGNDGTKAVKVFSKNKAVANYHGGVVAVGDHLFGFTTTNNQWVCYPYKSGKDPAWKAKGIGSGSVIAADGHLYCFGEKDGTCAMVKASEKEYAEVSRFQIPGVSTLRPKESVFAHPAIANGRLFLRDYEKLYVFDLAP